eukprot:9702-Heterococcus_DN1.PRE.1
MASHGAQTAVVALGDLTLFVKDLRAPHSRKRKLVVKSWVSVKDVKALSKQLLSSCHRVLAAIMIQQQSSNTGISAVIDACSRLELTVTQRSSPSQLQIQSSAIAATVQPAVLVLELCRQLCSPPDTAHLSAHNSWRSHSTHYAPSPQPLLLSDMLAKLLQVPVTMQRLFYRGRELRNMRLLHDCGIDSTGCTLFFAIHREVSQRAWALEPFDSLEPPKSLTRIMNQ